MSTGQAAAAAAAVSAVWRRWGKVREKQRLRKKNVSHANTVKKKLQFFTAFITGIVFKKPGSKFQFHHLPLCIFLQYRPLKYNSRGEL